MVTTDANPIFLDTNTLVYATVAEAPLHTVARQRIQAYRQAGSSLWISRQILREYLAVLSRPQPFTELVPVETLTSTVRAFCQQFHIAEETPQVTEHLLRLMSHITIGGKQVHDANVVATMQAHSIRNLLTHNVRDFNRFHDYIDVLPLEG